MRFIKDIGSKMFSGQKYRYGLFECPFCKKIVEKRLQPGNRNKSCGCSQSSGKGGYAKSRHPLYNAWAKMISRCSNPNNKAYHNYGGRGILVCDKWKDSSEFIRFCLSTGWKHGLDIDRKNNDGNYEPENIRFVSRRINIRNTRAVKLNPEKVNEIQRRLKVGETGVSVAAHFGISPSLVSAVRNGKRWSDCIQGSVEN